MGTAIVVGLGWVLVSLLVGYIASETDRSFRLAFWLSLFFSPAVGLLVTLVVAYATSDREPTEVERRLARERMSLGQGPTPPAA